MLTGSWFDGVGTVIGIYKSTREGNSYLEFKALANTFVCVEEGND